MRVSLPCILSDIDMPVFICNLFLHHPELCRRNICSTSASKKRIQLLFLLLCSRFILSRGTLGYQWFWASSPRRWRFPGPFPIHISFSAFFSVSTSVIYFVNGEKTIQITFLTELHTKWVRPFGGHKFRQGKVVKEVPHRKNVTN